MKKYGLTIFLLLSACAQPQLRTPGVSEAELAQERQIQAQYSAEEQLRRQQETQMHRGEMQARLSRVFIPIARAGIKLCTALIADGSASCVYEARLSDEKDKDEVEGVNAAADGERIIVTPAMMRFAKEDGELAFVLSHELAHNILGHVSSTRQNAVMGTIAGILLDGAAAYGGVNTQGAFGNMGGSIGAGVYSQDFEREADYVGLYIMAGAGLDYSQAPNFWRRMSARNPDAIYVSTTHPTNPERFLAMQKTIEEIRQKKMSNMPLLPDLRPDT